MDDEKRYRRATFAAGCFWDAEAAFRRIPGVIATATGYTGGSVPDPTYADVSEGTTGHAEAVEILFDPRVVTYGQLLDAFWDMHDPTQQGVQGDYTGPQYRSAIYYDDDEERTEAERSRDLLQGSEKYRDLPIVTTIEPAVQFWPAEESHQQFYEKCGRGYCTERQADE